MYISRVLVLSALTLIGLASLFGQERTDDTIKIETRLVSVPVVVSDRNARYVSGLTKKDFKIFQDGVEQEIAFFASSEEPINVAVLIDTSQSTRPVLDDIKDSGLAFLKLLKPKDKAIVISFDDDTHLLSPLTSDTNQLKQAIKNAQIPNQSRVGTVMRDALMQTVENVFRDLTGRKAIILLTDGKDMGSKIQQGELLYRMQETDSIVYSVMFKTGPDITPQVAQRLERALGRRGIAGSTLIGPNGPLQRGNALATTVLTDYATTTGGRFFTSNDGKLKETFAAIVEELRFQYRLGFYPPDDDGSVSMHELKVKVSKTDAVVRARPFYRVKK